MQAPQLTVGRFLIFLVSRARARVRLKKLSRLPRPVVKIDVLSDIGSSETCLGPAGLEGHAHQRLRTLVAEHPGSIYPRVSLVVDAGAPHRLITGGHRARNFSIP